MASRSGPKGTQAGPDVNGRRAAALPGWHGAVPPVDPRIETLAGALAGEGKDLAEALSWPDLCQFAATHKVGAAVALACRRGKLSPCPVPLRHELYWATGRNLLAQETLSSLGETLGEAGVPWVVIKGADLAGRVYGHPGERTFTDVDILMRGGDLARALEVLGRRGWLDEAQKPPDAAALLRGERYVLCIGRGLGLLVELHYRLWGWMPAGMGEAAVEAAEANPQWGPTARRPTLPWALLLAAVHTWQVLRPRPLAVWRDLERLTAAGGEALVKDTANLACRWGVELPVALAAWQAGTLWRSPPCAALAGQLLAALRLPERTVAARFAGRGEGAISLPELVLARLLAHRSSRLGWRSVTQVVFPDEATVQALTGRPADWRGRLQAARLTLRSLLE